MLNCPIICACYAAHIQPPLFPLGLRLLGIEWLVLDYSYNIVLSGFVCGLGLAQDPFLLLAAQSSKEKGCQPLLLAACGNSWDRIIIIFGKGWIRI